MTKVLQWIKKPENIVVMILLIAVTVIGIIDNNLEILIIIYLIAFSIGLLLRLFFYIKDRK